MSRTYRCTNGASKKINNKFRGLWFYSSCHEERQRHIDKNNFTDFTLALSLRIGIQHNAPKNFRQHLKRSQKAKDKMNLKMAFINEEFENFCYSKFIKDANWHYW